MKVAGIHCQHTTRTRMLTRSHVCHSSRGADGNENILDNWSRFCLASLFPLKDRIMPVVSLEVVVAAGWVAGCCIVVVFLATFPAIAFSLVADRQSNICEITSLQRAPVCHQSSSTPCRSETLSASNLCRQTNNTRQSD